MKTLWINLFWLTGIIFVSCTYEPDEDYFKEVERPSPSVFISLSDYDESDTISLYQRADFRFQVEVENASIKVVEVLFGNKVLISTESKSGTFSIDEENLRTGIHELKIQFTSNSGTGSLSDQLGGENIQVWRTWKIRIDVDDPPEPILTFSKQDGYLKLEWNAFNKVTFVDYTLTINAGNGFTRTVVLRNPVSSFWVDSSYLGGVSVTYTVSVATILTHVVGLPKTIYKPQALSIHYNSLDSTATLKWRKLHFPAALRNCDK